MERPSNQFWSVLVSIIALLAICYLILYILSMSCVGFGCFGLFYLAPIVFILSLIISFMFIYPRINNFLDSRYPPKISNKTKSKKAKPISIMLGVTLGIGTFILISFLVGEPVGVYVENQQNNIIFFVYEFVGIALPVFLSIAWSKIIDKFINH